MKCAHKIFEGYRYYNCSKNAVEGEGDTARCGTHSEAAKKRKNEKFNNKMEEMKKVWENKKMRKEALQTLVNACATSLDPAIRDFYKTWEGLNKGPKLPADYQ